jgi:hypothetical protein
VETPLSRLMLEGELKEGDRVRVGFEGGVFTFQAEPWPAPAAAGSGRPQPERPEAAAGTPAR